MIMTTGLKRGLLVLVVLAMVACGASPEVKKARHLENAEKFLAQKQYREAATEYYNVIKLDPNHKEANKRLASLFLTVGDADQAMRHYQKAKDIDPADLEVRIKIAQLFAMSRKTGDSRLEIESILEKDPKNLDAYALLAGLAATPEEVADTISRFEAVEFSSSDLPRRHMVMGQLFMKKGDLAKAESSYLDALQGESNLPEIGRAHV
jgi:Tfp pilus assembly protein PilF